LRGHKKENEDIPETLLNRTIDANEIVTCLCRKSFYDFVLEFWETIVNEDFVNNWHIKYICDELQTLAKRVFAGEPKAYDLIINIPPGTTKSTLVSILFNAWVWTNMPGAGFIGSSYTHSLAVEMSRKTRTVIKSEKYKGCYPDVKITYDQDAKGHFINTKGGARMCAGVDGDIVGRHADFIIIDDPLNPKGARSELDTLNANVFINETLWSRKKNKAITPMILIMQRLSENDPTGMMLKEWKKVRHICLPAEDIYDIKPPELKKHYVDGLLDPKRHTEKTLDEAKDKGEFFYAGQFGQSPIPLGGALFHVEKFNIERFPPKSWKIRMRYWDKAGTKDAGAYSVGVLIGKDLDSRFWILDVIRGRWATDAREANIKQTAILDGHSVLIGVEQEPGSGGKESAENTVRNLAGYTVRVDRPTGDKAQRADPYSTQVNAGNVYLVKAPWNKDYIEELRFFSLENSKYKDQVDASSGGFKFVSQPVVFAGGVRALRG
jgi:predicted phage terminase large subunit-like protein